MQRIDLCCPSRKSVHNSLKTTKLIVLDLDLLIFTKYKKDHSYNLTFGPFLSYPLKNVGSSQKLSRLTPPRAGGDKETVRLVVVVVVVVVVVTD